MNSAAAAAAAAKQHSGSIPGEVSNTGCVSACDGLVQGQQVYECEVADRRRPQRLQSVENDVVTQRNVARKTIAGQRECTTFSGCTRTCTWRKGAG